MSCIYDIASKTKFESCKLGNDFTLDDVADIQKGNISIRELQFGVEQSTLLHNLGRNSVLLPISSAVIPAFSVSFGRGNLPVELYRCVLPTETDRFNLTVSLVKASFVTEGNSVYCHVSGIFTEEYNSSLENICLFRFYRDGRKNGYYIDPCFVNDNYKKIVWDMTSIIKTTDYLANFWCGVQSMAKALCL